MRLNPAALRRQLIVPEVVQTSAMDCGPASLKSLLEGFGISVSYGRLREACQTSVDGTSINTMEEVALQLGLSAEQVMLPPDHILLPGAQALPAIIILRRPNGEAHFTVAWRRHGGLVQLMDPATGRRWPTCRSLLDELYIHEMPVAAAAWRNWAGTDEFLDPVRRRLEALGTRRRDSERLIESALNDDGWRSLAALDAVTRMMNSVVRSGALRKGSRTARVLDGFYRRLHENPVAESSLIPAGFWLVRPPPESPADQSGTLLVRGAVLVRASRAMGERPMVTGPDASQSQAAAAPLSPELAAALSEKPPKPMRELAGMLLADGALTPAILICGLILAAGGLVVEALLFRSFLDLGSTLSGGSQRLGAIVALLLFAGGVVLLELPLMSGLLRAGRKLEARLRVAFMRKLPRLTDRYFHSRPSSDMAERGHGIHALRTLPTMGGQLVRSVCTLLFTAAGIAWLDPAAAPLAFGAALISVALPLMLQPVLSERDMRVRTHAGALSRFYLDALLGILPIRSHGAERSMRREHESLLTEWVRAGLRLQRSVVAVDALISLAGAALAVCLLVDHWMRAGESGGILLFIYWTLSLPTIGQEVAHLARQYPAIRNVTLRVTEPLQALEEDHRAGTAAESTSQAADLTPRGVSIAMTGLDIRAAGHTILRDVTLQIDPGAHVAIVGPSGAGKSSLVGILLGWHKPDGGEVLIDGAPLVGAAIRHLRQITAWVDPAVQLWNAPLIDNITYGAHGDHPRPLPEAIQSADLLRVLRTLPEGMQTHLGEGGAFLSGGEGQRVRLARALLRPDARLVILDEAFRGLDRAQRRELIDRARRWWRNATLLCVTHDVGETLAFDRVLVIEDGCILEDGPPRDLAGNPGTRFAAMLEAERMFRDGLWAGIPWRRWHMADGQMTEAPPR